MEGGRYETALVTLLSSILLLSVSLNTIAAVDILRPNQTIKDGSTIVSAGGHFELGFTDIGTTTNRYVGIWYKKISIKTIVWIANRETPLDTTTGLLKLNSNGNLVILNGSDYVVWSSNSSTSVNNPVVQLCYYKNIKSCGFLAQMC
ncbi:G-type lectin S-receptor-like serine/threonine-protein kinase [Heracleum sosnowskyi]|uniref:G-type lectin S-receptor-like serine/threonine-protein kinase n=1 Tax=Heracleum sosnowskyi TaxID=360622 RepID=A0AAD8N0Y2_9APIA|nr:G-type lectin S-receptor-like serine/threonine-protein kinase [Heracleum sosnowskyi]